jgi:hypothetical protein
MQAARNYESSNYLLECDNLLTSLLKLDRKLEPLPTILRLL